MKNKFLLIALVLIIIFTIAGCSVEEPVENVEKVNSPQNAETAVETEKPNTEEVEEPEEPIVKETILDSSLEGIELLKSISS